jgi:hypothetical protein
MLSDKKNNKIYAKFSFFIIVVLGRGTLEHLQNFLQCIKYITLEFTPSSTLFHPLQFLEQFQQGSFFHLLTCIYIICATSPRPRLTSPVGRTYSTLLFTDCVEEKT